MVERDAAGRLIFAKRPVEQWLQEAGAATPTYVYDIDAIRDAARSLRAAFGELSHLVAYAVKANSAGTILRALRAEGCGADVVSGSELALALASGIAPDDIVFSGVAQQDAEIDRALGAGPRGIAAVQVESVEEIGRVALRARALGRRARISVRINPGVTVDTHAHVATGHDEAKFGVAVDDLGDAWEAVARHGSIDLVGVSSHVGSIQTSTGPYLEAARKLFDVARARLAAGAPLSFVDTGGGFGIDYGAGCPVTPADFARGVVRLYRERGLDGLRLVVEPGRSMVAAFGVLVASVVQTKHARASGRRWAMIDAGMNDLIRPALYQARHRIEAVDQAASAELVRYRVVGPICESSDDFGWYDLPALLAAPSLVVIRDAGAYGFTMASQYNGRPLPAEVFVEGGKVANVSAASSIDAWIERRLSA